MTTVTSTARPPRHHHHATDDERARGHRSRRPGARAFALGATIALLCAAVAWVAVDALHRRGSQTSAGGTAAAVQPTTTTGGTAATGSSGATTASSGTTPAAAAHAGTSYPAGQDVLALQRDLGQLNYYESPADGVDGPATVAAIKDFQRANGLPVDGIAGPNTMAKINEQLVTGDNQMGPSGPPAKPANTTPSQPANATPATPNGGASTGGTSANAQSGTANGSAAVGTAIGAGA